MNNKGLTKLSEECGELVTVCQKFIALRDQVGPEAVDHWDGSNMLVRMTEEIADVLGACRFVVDAFDLDQAAIARRADTKYDRFLYWSNGGTKIKPTPVEILNLMDVVHKSGEEVSYEGPHERRAAA